MNRSVCRINGVVIEMIDDRLKVNDVWVDTRELSKSKKIAAFSYGLCLGLGFALAIYKAMQV